MRRVSVGVLAACAVAVSMVGDALGQRPGGAQNRGAAPQTIGQPSAMQGGRSETHRATAEEAFRAEQNADNRESRTERRALRRENRGD